MWRQTAVMLGMLGVLASDASALPPPVHPPDLVTTFALCEGSRAVQRSLASPAEHPLRLKTIVIDPGHGGENKGAIGVAGVREKVLTMDLAYALKDALEARYPNTTVVLTRYWDRDVELDERTQWANELGAELFVSLHYNAATHDRAVGYETYFLAEETMATTAESGSRRKQEATKPQHAAFRAVDKARVKSHAAARAVLEPPYARSKALAQLIQDNLAKKLESTNRGVKQANFAVLRGARMPAVVVESGFLTHPEEGVAVLTDTHRTAIVEALIEGIRAFDATETAATPPVARKAAP